MDNEESQSLHVIPHQLCEFCRRLAEFYSQDIFWGDEAYQAIGKSIDQLNLQSVDASYAQPVAHHDSLADLEISAARGCHICALLCGTHSNNLQDHSLQLKPYFRLQNRFRFSCHELQLEMLASYNGVDEEIIGHVAMHNHSIEPKDIYCRDLVEQAMDSYGTEYQWCATTNCDEGYAMMDSWLRECIDCHEDCRLTFGRTRPSRLLDLNALNDQDIALVLTEEVGDQSYATLSYRWGTGACTKLTTLNLQQFKTHIILEALPKTIRDAIYVCRRLCMRYLWVDALCIIQEDGEDFALAISQMGSIYANCIFNIAASDSRDSESGCFRNRSPLQRNNCIVNTQGGVVMFFPRPYNYFQAKEEVEGSPLSYRGWVYQEQMLSPRTIHFLKDEVIWECRKGQKWFARGNIPKYQSSDLKKKITILTQDCPQHIQNSVFQFVWYSIISDYSRTEFSDFNDRLSALAGIAELSKRVFGYTISYGLITENILDGLLWHRKLWYDDQSYPDSGAKILDRIPSWTWLSKKLNVGYRDPSEPYKNVIQILVYSAFITRLPPATPFSSLNSLTEGLRLPDSFRIRCWVKGCQFVPFSQINDRHKAPESLLQWSLAPIMSKPNADLDTYIADMWRAIQLCAFDSGYLKWDATQPFLQCFRSLYQRFQRLKISGINMCIPDEQPSQTKGFFCILLKRIHGEETRPRTTLPPRTTVADFGLICEPIDSTKTTFRRLGYFHELVEQRMDHGSDLDGCIADLESRSPSVAYLQSFGFLPQKGNFPQFMHTPPLDRRDKGMAKVTGDTPNDSKSQERDKDDTVLQNLPELLEKLSIFRDDWEELEIELI